MKEIKNEDFLNLDKLSTYLTTFGKYGTSKER